MGLVQLFQDSTASALISTVSVAYAGHTVPLNFLTRRRQRLIANGYMRMKCLSA